MEDEGRVNKDGLSGSQEHQCPSGIFGKVRNSLGCHSNWRLAVWLKVL